MSSAIDNKISDLPSADSLTLQDLGIIVSGGTDKKFTLDTLVQLLAANIGTGSSVTTGTVNPQNTTGENGDVFINTTTNVLLQKVAGTWVNKYTFPGAQTVGRIRFFNGTPDNTVGNDGDLGLDYAGAKFYERANGVYVLRFSMLQGPAGATGLKGDKGDKGDNGNTILSGTSNPVNSIGKEGDFYINTSTEALFGPKYGGVWPATGIDIGGGIGPDNIGQGLIIDASNKITLDLATTQLVSPTIAPSWTLYQNDGSTPYTPATSTAKNIVVDKGVKANLSAQYQYPAAGAGQALPQTVSGSFGTSLPGPNNPSSALTVPGINGNSGYSVTLAKPKSGLIVSGSQVAFPSGNDTTGDSISISFQGRGCLAFFPDASLTDAQIQSVLNTGSAGNTAFQTGKARTFNGVTANGYTYYLLSNSLGRPTAVSQDGVDAIFGAFQFLADVTITNAAGAADTITVMRSNATNAFNNRTLSFS